MTVKEAFKQPATWFIFIGLALGLLFTACGDDDDAEAGSSGPTQADEQDVNPEDLQVIYKQVDNVNYMCLYVYAAGYHAGGPALWCERRSG